VTLDTRSWLGQISESGPPPLPARRQSQVKNVRKHILDALGATVWESSSQSFCHRHRGEDTLDWGSWDRWVQVKWVLCLVNTPQLEESLKSCLTGYDALRAFQEVAERTRWNQLERSYHLRDVATVRRFLQTYPSLLDVLIEAWPYLQKHFGPDPQVELQVTSEPEIGESQCLFAYIVTSLPVDDASERLDRLDQEWFLAQLDRVGEVLNFTLEFA